MHDSLTLIDMLLRGVAIGAMLLLAISVQRGGLGRDHRIAATLLAVSFICWVICESPTLWPALGSPYFLSVPAYAVGSFFWLFVVTTFQDLRVTPLTLAPAVIQTVLGFFTSLPPPLGGWDWIAMNSVGGLVSLHAFYVVARGWNGDLIEGRRRLRGPLLTVAAVFAGSGVAFGFAARFDPAGGWLEFTAGRPLGGAFASVLVVATAAMFLQARQAVFGSPRRAVQAPDPRAEAAERLMLAKLNELMDAGAWRREGLTIGQVAEALGEPEHRVRRLINQGLGHRNFADFVNSRRIQAAQRRLADPAEARTTIAAIAFDLGYGSLGPFNRAFREVSGATPTEWRRQALATLPDLQEAS